MKSFGPKAWVLPQPVLITFDPCHMGYIALGEKVGNAFSDGKNIR